MQKPALLVLAVVSLGLLLVACGSDDAEIERNQFQTAEEVLTFDFESTETTFETARIGQSAQTVADGQYQITSFSERGNHYLVGSNPAINLKNVMIEVTAEPRSGSDDGWYGVVCRTHSNDLGYALLVSADGFWSIARIEESVSGLQSLDYLENWQEHSAIDAGSSNQLLAYCVDDYLALYVNDEFVGDYRDDDYNFSGGIGLLAGNVENEAFTAAFDNLAVSGAFRDGNPNTATPAPTQTATPQTIETLPPLDALGDD